MPMVPRRQTDLQGQAHTQLHLTGKAGHDRGPGTPQNGRERHTPDTSAAHAALLNTGRAQLRSGSPDG
jgi:hypothetical protein